MLDLESPCQHVLAIASSEIFSGKVATWTGDEIGTQDPAPKRTISLPGCYFQADTCWVGKAYFDDLEGLHSVFVSMSGQEGVRRCVVPSLFTPSVCPAG